MDQVGYDTYCKLLDEVVKESKGILIEEEIDVTIDINVSSYIPDEFIENSSQKIEVYQNIALCRTEADIKNVIEDIKDRYGKIPTEVMSLMDIVRIKEICKNIGITKIAQKQNNIIFTFDPKIFTIDIDKIIKKYKEKIKFSPSLRPYITYILDENTNVINEIKEFLNDNSK